MHIGIRVIIISSFKNYSSMLVSETFRLMGQTEREEMVDLIRAIMRET